MSALQRIIRPELAHIAPYGVPRNAAPTKLDANECAFPLSEAAREKIAERVASIPWHRYPDPRATELRACLAARYGGTPDEYVVGSGSDELIALLISVCSGTRNPGTPPAVLYPTPTFVMYGIIARTQGWRAIEVPLTDAWQLDPGRTRDALAKHAPNLVFLASPNSPTGNELDLAFMSQLIAEFPDTLFVIDRAYAPFSSRRAWGEPPSKAARLPENLAILNTLSKIGMAAARIGCVRMPEGLAVELNKVRLPFNLSQVAQEVGVLALTELRMEIDACVEQILAERRRLAEGLSDLGFASAPSDANFLWTDTGQESAELARRLREEGVGVRSFSQGRLARHVRITVGTAAENDELLRQLRRV